MASIDVDQVVRAVLWRRWWPAGRARVAVVPREPGCDAGVVAVGRAVLADRRIRRRFGRHVAWVTAGRECPDSATSWDLQHGLLTRLSPGTAVPYDGWLFQRDRLMRRHRRLLLVVDDTGGGWSPANLFSERRGHVNLLLAATREGLPAGSVVVEVDAAAAVGAARADLAARAGLPGDADRVAELAVFFPGEPVPVGLVRSLWRVTGGLSLDDTDRLLHRVAGAVTVDIDGGVTLDPTAHAVLRHDRPAKWFAAVGAALVDDLAARLPRARPLIATGPDRAWWELDPANAYLWERLVWHLLAAGRQLEAELLAGDLRWVTARLMRTGPGGPLRDLMAVVAGSTERVTTHLRDAYKRASARLDPPDDVLHHALRYANTWREDPYRPNPWAEQVRVVEAASPRPRLVPRWRPADDPQRHGTPVPSSYGFDVSPDGRLLAVAGGGKFVTVTDLVTGEAVASMKCYSRSRDVTFGSDGTWLALRTWDNYFPGVVEDPPVSSTVQVWDIATQSKRFEIRGHFRSHISGFTISPDGRRLTTSHEDGTRAWDTTTGGAATDPPGGAPAAPGPTRISPDGVWRAEVDGADVRLWNVATGAPGPVARTAGPLRGVRWLPKGLLAHGDYGLYVFDVIG